MALPAPRSQATCLITGASSGLGAAFSRQLAARGHDVTLVARRVDRLEALARELRDSGGTAQVLACDLARPAERRRLTDHLADREVDVLINNAGFGTAGRYLDASAKREREMVAVNVDAPVELCRALLPPMVERGTGAVLNVSSIAAFQPMPGMSLYGGTKAMLLSFSAALHAELAGSGVSVTVMCPGGIRTEFATVAGAGGLAARLPPAVWMTPEAVAAHGIAGMERGKWLVVPGRLNRIGGAIGRHVPRSLLLGAAGRLAMRPTAATHRGVSGA
jgi:short-subunit dehydrogenase